MGLVAAVVIGIALLTGVALVLGLLDSSMSAEPVDRLDNGLPDRPLTSHDVGGLRFRIGLRGYRMDDVDVAIGRLGEALRQAEERSEAAERAALQTAEVEAAPKRTRSRRAAPPAEPTEAD